MVRSIEVVEDIDASQPEHRFRSAASLLDQLSAPMFARFRRQVRDRYRTGSARLLCGKCGKPVYISAGTGRPEERDGRDAFFAHHAGMAGNCEWGTTGENPRDVDRRKYGGITEGALHRRLKAMLASMLEADSAFSEVRIEHVISRPPDWRKPDIAATFLDGLIAFDLQLATTQLPVIVARESFYEGHSIRYVWVTNSNDAHGLARQAFQDIYWNNDAQIFGIDERAEAITRKQREVHLWALTVAPRLDEQGLRSVWESRLVPRGAIDWNTPSRRPRFPDADFSAAFCERVSARFEDPRKRIIHAVCRPDQTACDEAGTAWNEIARQVGAPSWASAETDRIFKAIGVLASAAAGKKMDASKYPPEAMTAMFNQFLETNACRGWTSALQHIAAVHGHEQLLSAESTQAKAVRNLAENHPDLQRKYSAMLGIIFPKSALSRLTGPPVEIYEV